MKKTLTALIISIIVLGFSFKLDFSLIGYLTYDLNSGNLDNFPIANWTLTLPEPLNSFSIRATDYLSNSHGITNIAGYNVIVPRYYFVDTRFDWNNLRVNFQVGRLRLSRNLSQNFESVRLGGFKFDTYQTSSQLPLTIGGIAGYVSGKYNNLTYEIGGAYSSDLSKYALYGTLGFDFNQFGSGKIGMYYETRYNNLSANYLHQLKGNYGQIDMWAGVAAVQTNLVEPSFIIGSSWKNGPIYAAGQFIYIGANKYDVEFASGEPTNPNATNTWVLMTEAGYNFNQFYLGVFMKENSVWLANGYIPLYGLKFKVGDLSISLANGDLSSKFVGDQNILIQLTYNYKASVDFVQAISSITLPFQSKISTSSEESKVKIANLYTMPEGSKVTTSGIMLAPTGLLSSATTYIQDETAAIMLYGKSIPTNLQPGDLVSVSGTTKVYNGILEIVVDSITKVGTKQPKAVETKKVEIKHLSNLVKVQGTVKNVSKDTVIIDTGEAEVKLFVKSATGISLSEIKQGMKLTVTGIVSLYKDELEILPRYQEDIVIEK